MLCTKKNKFMIKTLLSVLDGSFKTFTLINSIITIISYVMHTKLVMNGTCLKRKLVRNRIFLGFFDKYTTTYKQNIVNYKFMYIYIYTF